MSLGFVHSLRLVDTDASFDSVLDSDVLGRKEFGEFFGHILVFGGAFKVTKYLIRDLASELIPTDATRGEGVRPQNSQNRFRDYLRFCP